MPRHEQVAYLELAKSHLPQLVAECARSDNRSHSSSDNSNSSSSDGNQWRRVKFKKKSDVYVWEKGDDVSSSSSSGRAKPSAVATLHASGNRIDSPNVPSLLPPPAQPYAVRSAVRVPAPLDVVLKTLDCSAVTTYRSFTKIIYESLVADTSVLFHSQSSVSPTDTPAVTVPVTPCSASESLAVRWLVCRCNNPMVSDCDLCLLEYAKVTSVDDAPPRYDGKPLFTIRAKNNSSSGSGDSNQGSHGSNSSRPYEGLHDRREFPSAYKILCSIETKSCPELLDSHRLARCVVPLGGFLFYPTDNVDVTDVVFYMSIAPPAIGSSSSNRQFRATQRVLQHMARGVGRIKNAVDAYTMSLRLEMLRNTRWVRNTERAECVVCYRRFHQLTRRRHHCRLCGDVICRDCSVYKDADLPTIGPTVLRICKLCDLNELKTSAGSAAAAAAMNPSRSNAAAAFEPEELLDDPVPAVAKPLTRKRSTTLNVDTTKAAVLAAADEPEIGRRFTTVVDGKDRRELPEHAFSCSKADIARRTYKWNTGGGGKPLVILSPTSAALYATRTGKSAAVDAKSTRFAKAMTPTGKMTAPQDWHAAVHPSSYASSSAAPSSNQFQAKSCSKMASSHDRFVLFDKVAFRGKGAMPRDPATTLNQENEREDKVDASASRQQPHHAARVVKSGKLIVPGHEHDGASKRKTTTTTTAPKKTTPKQQLETKGNQHKDASSELTVRKLPRVDEYNDILLTLCEQVSKALACKYAALSLFTSSPHPTPPASSATTSGGQRFGGSLPPSPTLSAASFETVHFLKAAGSKKLTSVAANLMCCAPVLELKEKLVTRDALGHANVFDFKRLPIVIGPQQVRFYAGIPLVDSSGQMLGALAVFDASVYQSSSLAHVLPSMEALATVALSAIEARKTDVELKSFLRHPLVDTARDNQATRGSDPIFHIDLDLRDSSGLDSDVDFEYDADDDGVDFEYPARRRSSAKEAQIREGYATRSTSLRPPSPLEAPDAACDIEYYKNQMEQLVQQARETEAQMLETSMAMKRQGVTIW